MNMYILYNFLASFFHIHFQEISKDYLPPLDPAQDHQDNVRKKGDMSP